jgi:hypothetical protein
VLAKRSCFHRVHTVQALWKQLGVYLGEFEPGAMRALCWTGRQCSMAVLTMACKDWKHHSCLRLRNLVPHFGLGSNNPVSFDLL